MFDVRRLLSVSGKFKIKGHALIIVFQSASGLCHFWEWYPRRVLILAPLLQHSEFDRLGSTFGWLTSQLVGLHIGIVRENCDSGQYRVQIEASKTTSSLAAHWICPQERRGTSHTTPRATSDTLGPRSLSLDLYHVYRARILTLVTKVSKYFICSK